MIPEFKFKKKTAFLKKKELKSLIVNTFANKSFRIAGVAAAGVFVLGLTVLGVYGQETVKKKENVEALVYTAGVTTQIDTTERAIQDKINQVSASVSKKEGVATTGLSLASVGGVSMDGVSEEAVSEDDVNEEIAAEETSVAVVADASGQAVAEEPVPVEPEKPQIVGFSNPGIANVEQFVNIRKEPNESGEICGKLSNHAACEILSETNGWYEVVTNGVQGYVKADYLITGDAAWELADQLKIAYVKVITETLYVREAPNTESRIIELVSLDQKLNLLEIQEEWVKVQINGAEGYLNKSYIAIEYTLPKGEAVETKKEEKKEEKSDKKNKKDKSSDSSKSSSSTKEAKDCSSVIEYATQFVGNPYVYGGTSLTKGADCSGFTMSVYAKFGVYLPHSSSAQAGCGTSVSRSDIQPGDLIFYGNGGGINHVALYIGGGKIVHASTEKTGIKISNAFYRTPAAIRRVMR